LLYERGEVVHLRVQAARSRLQSLRVGQRRQTEDKRNRRQCYGKTLHSISSLILRAAQVDAECPTPDSILDSGGRGEPVGRLVGAIAIRSAPARLSFLILPQRAIVDR
jgi:hypothetical protein